MFIKAQQIDKKLTLTKTGNVYGTRVEAVERMVIDTIDKFKLTNDFSIYVSMLDNSPLKSSAYRAKVYFFNSTHKEYDALFPCYIYDSWPESGINNTEQYCKSFIDTTPLTNNIGWIGANTIELRRTVVELSKGSHFIDASFYDRIPSVNGNPVLPFQEQINKWKYLLDIEGFAWSGRLKILLRSPRIVFMVDRPYEEWFSPFIVPWKHYVPVKRDLSDLEENYYRLESDKNLQNYISENQKIFANEYLTRDAALSRIKDIIELTTVKPSEQPTITSATGSETLVVRKPLNTIRESWEKADSFLTAIVSRGIIASAVDVLHVDSTAGKRVSDEVYEQRRISCFGDGNNVAPCPLLKYNEEKPFCGACGCGSNKLAILSPTEEGGYSKLHYPYLECPLKKPGFSNEEKSS